MNNIKKIVIKGFRKFKNFSLDFNDKNNIIIGDNESGKSTLLEAIDLVLNKRYSNFDKYIIREIINNDLKDDFVIEKIWIKKSIFEKTSNSFNNRSMLNKRKIIF